MPGRTENNVKNRFNMMFKNVKDNFIKNKTHQSIFVMQEKVNLDLDIQEQINEEQLILDLIAKKKAELEEKRVKDEQNKADRTNEDIEESTFKLEDGTNNQHME